MSRVILEISPASSTIAILQIRKNRELQVFLWRKSILPNLEKAARP